MAELTGDKRFNDYVEIRRREERTDVYLQRILDHSTNTKGYKFTDLEAKAKEGIPALMKTRTNPEGGGLRAGVRLPALVHQERAGWSSTARRTSSSRPARTCRSTASRSIRPSTSRT